MFFPKAMYAFAATQGIDLQGYGDPFPTDQLFPSFLTERVLGPTGGNAEDGYWGINPGFAGVDILNTFAGGAPNSGVIEGGPLRGVLGSLTPAIKTPMELFTGTTLGTGAPITDYSDYLDMQNPLGVNTINAVTGFSPSSPLEYAFGQDPDLTSMEGWTSRPVNKGNKERFNNPAMWNYLFGVGATDMSQPSYINLAEIEKRNGGA